MHAIGSELANLRKKRELSQTELASEVGIASSSLSRIEAGERLPNVETLTLLLEALEAPRALRRELLESLDALYAGSTRYELLQKDRQQVLDAIERQVEAAEKLATRVEELSERIADLEERLSRLSA